MTAPEKRVDLGVTDISYDGTLFYDGTLKQGQWVYFKALIKNYGPDDLSSNWLSSDYKVTYAYRWGAIGIFTEWGGGEGGNGLFSGSSEWRKESTSLWLTRSGTLQVKVSVAENRSDTVETDSSDNTRIETYTVGSRYKRIDNDQYEETPLDDFYQPGQSYDYDLI